MVVDIEEDMGSDKIVVEQCLLHLRLVGIVVFKIIWAHHVEAIG